MTQVNAILDDETVAWLERFCKANGTSKRTVVGQVVAAFANTPDARLITEQTSKGTACRISLDPDAISG